MSKPANASMTTEVSTTILAAVILLFASTAVVTATDGSSPECGDALMAAEYDGEARQYDAAGRRYRSWASAEQILGSGAFGKRYTVRYFEERAHEMDVDAERIRALADKARRRSSARGAPDACNDATTHGNG